MLDAFLFYQALAERSSEIIKKLGIKNKGYCLATLHREENTDDAEAFVNILNAVLEIAMKDGPVLIPVHPRTRKTIERLGERIQLNSHLVLIPPVSYMDMIVLGVRGHGLVKTLLLGSTTDRVVRQAPCPVLSVSTKAREV